MNPKQMPLKYKYLLIALVAALSIAPHSLFGNDINEQKLPIPPSIEDPQSSEKFNKAIASWIVNQFQKRLNISFEEYFAIYERKTKEQTKAPLAEPCITVPVSGDNNCEKPEPNFCGTYAVIQVGCGTHCSFYHIVNTKNKSNAIPIVYSFDPTVHEGTDVSLFFRKDSCLLIARWGDPGTLNEQNTCHIEAIKLKNNMTSILKTAFITDSNICYAHDLLDSYYNPRKTYDPNGLPEVVVKAAEKSELDCEEYREKLSKEGNLNIPYSRDTSKLVERIVDANNNNIYIVYDARNRCGILPCGREGCKLNIFKSVGNKTNPIFSEGAMFYSRNSENSNILDIHEYMSLCDKAGLTKGLTKHPTECLYKLNLLSGEKRLFIK